MMVPLSETPCLSSSHQPSPITLKHLSSKASSSISLAVYLYLFNIAAEGDFGCGVPQCPFVRPKTGMGGKGHSRGETRCQSGPNVRYLA